jgi:hypothetical protein
VPTTPIRRVRFPDGDVEYRSTRGELAVGMLLRSRGVLWRVTGYDGDTVIVVQASADEEPGFPPGIDETLPYPLGIEAPVFEVMSEA